MKSMWLSLAAAAIASLIFAKMLAARSDADTGAASPIFGVTIPEGYRQWQMIAPSQLGEPFDELRAILGNDMAIKAYGGKTLPFPDGTVLAKLAWKRIPASDFPAAIAPGVATSIQFMVKDSKGYAATGGWGFGKFVDGKPADEAEHRACFACHEAHVKAHDFVFTRFAP
ncbi:MAG: cytochrome P460 family protein [Enhydrobacter sp.]|nr:cytochrome P460 family protein [Enhydrobacter sp.]